MRRAGGAVLILAMVVPACETTSSQAETMEAGSTTVDPDDASSATTVLDMTGADTSSSTGPELDCALPDAATRNHLVGSMTLDGVEAPDEALATGSLDPLVGLTIDFCATFDLERTVDTPDAQRSITIDAVSIATNGSGGVLDELFSTPTMSSLVLRLESFSPFQFIAVLGLQLDEGFINWELVCESPDPFELDAAGLPAWQSFQCVSGSTAIRRFLDAGQPTDIAFGPASFEASVP